MVLDGHQFFANEIQPVLALAANDAMNEYNTSEDPSWLAAHVAIVSTKVKVNALAQQDDVAMESGLAPKSIAKGSSTWAEIDAVLAPVSDYDDVSEAVDALPRDSAPLAAGVSWLRPALALGVLAVAGYAGYRWAHK